MSSSAKIPQDILDRLAPDYRKFIEANPPEPFGLHGLEWSPMFREPHPQSPHDMAKMPPVPVGSRRTIDLGNFSIQVLAPEGEAPSRGWPVVMSLHGGGWVFGDASMHDGLLSRVCVEVQCVTVSVEHRLAPEHPFPAELNDSWDALLWLRGDGKEQLKIDSGRIALLGTSSGGNLAAVIAQRARLVSPPIALSLQILFTPVIDASFSALDKSGWPPSMVEFENIFALPALDMLWLRDRYLPNVGDRTNPEASPNYQTNKAAFEGMAPAWIVIAELDALRDEVSMYAEKLRQFGVPVTEKLVKGVTHMSVAADKVCEAARIIRDEMISELKVAFTYA